MKIVQSLWSKPSNKTAEININDRNIGGWLNKKYYCLSWALSCLQFKKFYNDVELVTDQPGYELLINHLRLPYTNVHVVLDALDSYHPDLWSLGKIYAYGMQRTPFIHADGDVFIWEQFSENVCKSHLIAQNLEVNFEYYSTIYDSVKKYFKFIPQVLEGSIKYNKGQILAANAGILGGSDNDFFQDYSQIAFEFVEKNLDGLKNVNVGLFNIIAEQFLFHSLAEQKGYRINYLLQNLNKSYDGICELTDVPVLTKYAHAVGHYKKKLNICSLIEYRLQVDFPDYYYKILNLLKTSQI